MPKESIGKTRKQLVAENGDLRARLQEAEEALRAIRGGEVDALIVPGEGGEQVFTLKDADHPYRVLIENMSEGALTLTTEGVILYANRRFGEMLGTPLEKVIGSMFHAWIAPDSRRILESLQRKGGSGKCRGQLELMAGDGTTVLINLSVSKLIVNDMPDFFCLVASDLTEQKQRVDAIAASEKLVRGLLTDSNQSRLALLSLIEDQKQAEEALAERNATLNAILESAATPVFSLDRGYRYTSFNKAHAAAMKALYGSEIKIGKSLLEYQTVPEDRETSRENLDRALRGEQLVESAFSGEPGLSRRYFEIAHNPIRDTAGEVIGASVFVIDITERKQAEQALREYSSRLETEVGLRTRELSEAQEKLVRQERLATLGQVAGSIGHELRNPLGVISNAIYYLKIAQPEAGGKVREYFDIIEKETRASDKIVTDLLDFARIKIVDREPAAVAELVRRTLERFPAPPYVRVEIDIPAALPPVYADPNHVVQVLGNLIVNAYHAMPERGELRLSAAAQGDMASIRVQDSGVGIPPENMKKLFEPLFTTKIKGIGLGLAVSKKLAEANGGRIEVMSEAGKGSAFTVYLPVRAVGYK